MKYFGDQAKGRAEGATGAYGKIGDAPAIEVSPGITIRSVVGERLMMNLVTIEPHTVADVHTHDEEQMGIVLGGTCTFDLDGEVRALGEGDTYHAPPGVPHGLRTGVEECRVLDVFSPPRAALLAMLDGR